MTIRPRHYPALDGIRGLAIVLVLIWHYGAIENTPGSLVAYMLVPLRLTYTGVDLFFVLSGFLIGGILIDSRRRPGYFSNFYIRRALRIIPLYLVTLALFAVLVQAHASGVRGLEQVTAGPLPPACYLTLTQNWCMAAMGVVTNGFSVSWSLAVEEQVYLLLPLVIWFTSPRHLPLVVGLLVAGAVVVRLFLSDEAAYVLTPSRLDAVGAGISVALLVRHHAAWSWLRAHPRLVYGLLGVLGAAYGAIVLRVIPVYPFGYTLLAALYGTLLLSAILVEEGPIARLCRARWLRYMGTISYGVYLLHVGILMLLHGVILGRDERYPEMSDLRSVLVTAAALVLTLGLAALSWHFLESRILGLRSRIPFGLGASAGGGHAAQPVDDGKPVKRAG